MRVPVPRQISKGRFVSMGAISWVYKIADGIVIKYARNIDTDEVAREHAIYGLLKHHPPCPFVMQSFPRVLLANFLPHMAGSLDERLRRNQRRERWRVLEVLRVEERPLVERWAAQVCAADARLEALGLVHCDLRPTNMLLDERDHLKLTDFDCVGRVGDGFVRQCSALGAALPRPADWLWPLWCERSPDGAVRDRFVAALHDEGPRAVRVTK